MVGVALFCLIVMCIWRFLLALSKIARSSFARAIQLLLQGPGVWIMGRVVRNAAFGGQCTQVLGPHQLLEKERARRETISHELNQKMNNLSASTATRTGDALYYAFSE